MVDRAGCLLRYHFIHACIHTIIWIRLWEVCAWSRNRKRKSQQRLWNSTGIFQVTRG